MISITDETKIYLSNIAVDMRKSIDGLSLTVLDELAKSPQSDSIFIFYNRAKDKIKILTWHRNGFVLYYKRLEQGKFKFPKAKDDVYCISHQQLTWLIAGLDFNLMNEFKEINYDHFY